MKAVCDRCAEKIKINHHSKYDDIEITNKHSKVEVKRKGDRWSSDPRSSDTERIICKKCEEELEEFFEVPKREETEKSAQEIINEVEDPEIEVIDPKQFTGATGTRVRKDLA